MSKTPTARTQVVYRSAVTGRIATRDAAVRAPSTHVREVNKVPSPPPKRGK
jgi:hypothetical protein